MELKLNVYGKGKKVEKTYAAEEFTLMTGTCEDILKVVDVDKLMSGKLSDEQMGIEIIKTVTKSFKLFCPLLQEVFDGLTAEEYRRTSVKEVANCVINVVKYTVSELFNVGGAEKN